MKKLYIATERFPFENGEKTFIGIELEKLLQQYDVTIISHANTNVKKRRIAFGISSIDVVNICIKIGIWKKIYYLFRYFFSLDGIREVADIVRSKGRIGLKLYQSIGFYLLALENWRCLSKLDVIKKDTEFIFYSYWYYYYTYSMTRMKNKFPKMKIITRTHGFELYHERYSGGRQPFKSIMDKRLDRIIFACDFAKRYYIDNISFVDSSKYIVSKIGTPAPIERKNIEKEENFVLVSCSRVVKLKRVDLIIDALALWQGKIIEWHHFGDGEEFQYICQYAKKKLERNSQVVYFLHGYTENQIILDFYSKRNVGCFILTSSTEGGAPVSIQEAMAYGIPIIGASVGGITEMIKGNGILLDKNPTPADIGRALENIIRLNVEDLDGMRECSRKIWQEEYQAEVNSDYVLELINSL